MFIGTAARAAESSMAIPAAAIMLVFKTIATDFCMVPPVRR
jgi:hypothetical protein